MSPLPLFPLSLQERGPGGEVSDFREHLLSCEKGILIYKELTIHHITMLDELIQRWAIS